MTERKFTEEEDNYIRENVGNKTFLEISKALKCSIVTVQKRAELLGISFEKKTVKRWTNEEIELLKLMSQKYSNKVIADKLNRPVQEINKKAKKLGIVLIFESHIWDDWKIKFLQENINKINLTKMQKILHTGYYSIMKKLDELGLEYYSNKWTEEEEKTLVELAPKCHINEIAKLLNKDEASVISKARRLGINYITLKRNFTEEELEYIKKNWGVITISEIARSLKASRSMIQTQANTLGLPKIGNTFAQKWTEDKIEKLKVLAQSKTIKELAKYFKTTNEAISTIASRNSITLINEKFHWTNEEIELLEEYAKTMNADEIADKMNKAVSAVRTLAKRKGITLQKKKRHVEIVWTDEDLKLLKELALQEKTVLEIASIMNKNDKTLLLKAKELGINIKRLEKRNWSEEEIKKLILLSKTKKINELAKELGRTSQSIYLKIRSLGIPIIQDKKTWTDDECKRLEYLAMVEKKSPKEIAKLLGRTEDAINIKIKKIGLNIQINNKRYWTSEEEDLLSELWGNISINKIARRLNRTVSSVKNKAYQLGLGSQVENNYDGINISTICEMFKVRLELVSIYWVALGLKVKKRYISQFSSYSYVEISDLFDFLEKNQNIWDSRLLEELVLGKEPEWLKQKRINDRNAPVKSFNLESLTKQQLIVAKKYFLEHKDQLEEIQEEHSKQIVKK